MWLGLWVHCRIWAKCFFRTCYLTFWEKPQALFVLCMFCIYYFCIPDAKSVSICDIFCMFSFFLNSLLSLWISVSKSILHSFVETKCIYKYDLRFFESYILLCLTNKVILACKLEIKSVLRTNFKAMPYIWSLNIAKFHYL